MVERTATDLEIFQAKSVPPQTTRARLRGEFIKRAQEQRRDFTVDWVHLKLNDQAQRTVLCKDPFRLGRRARGEADLLACERRLSRRVPRDKPGIGLFVARCRLPPDAGHATVVRSFDV